MRTTLDRVARPGDALLGLSVRTLAFLAVRRPSAGDRAERERGDVPGWVLITLMTAFLVVAIWQLAGDQLKAVLDNAFNHVNDQTATPTTPGG